MKRTILQLLLLLVATVNIAVAQDNSKYEEWKQQKQQREAAFEQTITASPAAKILHEKLEQNVSPEENGKIILAAGKAGDKSVIPYLKLLAVKDPFYADVALAQLGENEYYEKILAELNNIRYTAISKLVLIGNKAAYKKLYELLNDTSVPPVSGDILHSSKSEIVMIYLGREVKNPPRLPNGNVNTTDVADWKAWFARNKHLIE